jgi:DNA polymerase elongation subunit (family B)
MGFVLKRRDNALIVKEIVGNAIKKILFEKDISGSIKYIKESIHKMFLDYYGIEKFIITKTLKTTYSNPDQMCHVVLSKRIGERDPGNRPKVGDRIPYVFIDLGREVELQGERVESPDYVIQNKLSIDYGYYVTNQLMNPLMQVYSLLYGDKTEEILFGDTLRYINQKKNHLTLITMYYDRNLKSELGVLEGEKVESEKKMVVKKKSVAKTGVSSQLITSFFKSV